MMSRNGKTSLKEDIIINGLIHDDAELILKTLKPGKCPRCAGQNPVDAKYCSTRNKYQN